MPLWVLQRNRASAWDTVSEDSLFYEKLPHTIMEAEKSHDLLSTNYRFWKVCGVIQSESEDLKTRGNPDVNLSPVLGEDEMKYPNSSWQFSSVQFSRSVVSNSLQPHELQYARPPCPSPTRGVYSDSCPSSQWCHPDISSPVVPFSSCPQSVPASASFPMSQLFTWAGVSALVCFWKCSCLFSIYSADFLLYIWIIWLLFWVENI